MLYAIDRHVPSIDRTALSKDPLLVQPSIGSASMDRSLCANDGWSCTIDHPWTSINACTVRHVDD